MGFGKKTDFASGRILDLDKSYRSIIKPAAEAAGLECHRADELSHPGPIDVPMYEKLLEADVVIADISTSNSNVFYELGVRHALRPFTTITIAEDRLILPFDINHIAVRKYHHLGEGIDFEEVVRMRGELTGAIEAILANPKNDSPIYTFFSDLRPPVRKKLNEAVAQSAPRFSAEGGYTLGMIRQRIDISDLFAVEPGQNIKIKDPAMETLIAAGYLALNLSRGNFSVIKQTLTFGEETWAVLLTLLDHFGISPKAINKAILASRDALELRLLARICIHVKAVECADGLCRVLLAGYSFFRAQFRDLRQEAVTPLRQVLRDALGQMPADALPVLEQYCMAAKAQRKWQQKRLFESALADIRRIHGLREGDRNPAKT